MIRKTKRKHISVLFRQTWLKRGIILWVVLFVCYMLPNNMSGSERMEESGQYSAVTTVTMEKAEDINADIEPFVSTYRIPADSRFRYGSAPDILHRVNVKYDFDTNIPSPDNDKAISPVTGYYAVMEKKWIYTEKPSRAKTTI